MTTHQEAAKLPSLTGYVADFITGLRFEDIPAEVVALGNKSILDSLACAICGSVEPVSLLMRKYVATLGSTGESAVFGTAERLTPRFASLLNGTAMHADDYDDTYQASPDKIQGLHATAPVVAAVIALAEPNGATGKNVVTAIQAGIEVGSRIFDACAVEHIGNGFHCTGTSGMLGAAAGAARYLSLTNDQTRRALSLAATQTGTLMCQLGTMTKPFHSGLAAECAVVSADLAALDMTASPIALEARWGFFHAEGGTYDEHYIRGLLGKPWTFVDRGQWLKPWPTGSLAHTAYTLLLQMITKDDIKPEQVAKIKIRTRQSISDTLFHHHPKKELEAKFSIEFGLSTIMIERKITLDHFHDEFVMRPDVQAMIEKVDYQPFPDKEAFEAGYTLVTSFIDLELKDGRVISGRNDWPLGSKANPMSYERVAEKFRECADFAKWPRAKADEVIRLVEHLEDLKDIRTLTAALSR